MKIPLPELKYASWDPSTGCCRGKCLKPEVCGALAGCPYEPNAPLDDMAKAMKQGTDMNFGHVDTTEGTQCDPGDEQPVTVVPSDCIRPGEHGGCDNTPMCVEECAGRYPEGSRDTSKDTKSSAKPNIGRDVVQSWPWAMFALAQVVVDAEASGHGRLDWQGADYCADGTVEGHLHYFLGKLGRHLAMMEIEGPVNFREGNQLHPAAVAWSALGYLEIWMREFADAVGADTPQELLQYVREELKP